MSLTAYPTLLEKLKSKKFREAFLSSSVRYRVALQVRALRKKYFESQKALGQEMGKPANVISRLENPNYGKLTIQTLLELAAAFGVGLIVKFASFSEVIEHSENLDETFLVVPQFTKELEAELETKISVGPSVLANAMRMQNENIGTVTLASDSVKPSKEPNKEQDRAYISVRTSGQPQIQRAADMQQVFAEAQV